MEKTTLQTGQVYCHLTGQDNDHWAAFQIIDVEKATNQDNDEDKILFMDLDWYADRKPTAEEIKNIGPLAINRFSMDHQLSLTLVGVPDLSTAELPIDTYTLLGSFPLPEGIQIKRYGYQASVSCKNLSGQTHGMSMEWPFSDAATEQWWMGFPEEARNNYKKSHREEKEIFLFGKTLNSAYGRLSIPDNAIQDWSILDQFGCLTSLECEGRQDGLTDYLKTRPLIELLSWKNCTHPTIDLRNGQTNWLHKVFIGGEALQELILGDEITSLDLEGKLHPGLQITQASGAKNLNLTFRYNTVDGQVKNFNLPFLNGLMVFDKKVDAASIVAAYPNLQTLDIRCDLGIIQHFSALGQLHSLQAFTLFDAFGYMADEFPKRLDWQKLDYLYIQTYPAEAGNKIKKEFSGCKEFELRLPKKPEWIADNLDNPFHSWEAYDIPESKVKKAANAYKKASAAIRSLKQPVEKTALVPVLKAFVTELNKLSDHIMTSEREDVYVIYQELLNKAGISEDETTYHTLLDEWRDF